ncbi:RecT family recombinase [Sutcliffiella sp. FSL R7-0096]|uniref:RecT family recombinase n=1 Tax=Sutcliffiella sp. FSL R7-0096 TaxID=2921670 RepID=UPI003159EB00
MSNKNQMAIYTPEIMEAFKPEVISVMRNSFAPNATDPEFVLFAHKAASYGLDPFKNEIFFIKYGSTARIQFAAEAYLSKAREREGFQPPDTQMVHENDEFQISKNTETKELEVVKHEIGFPRGKIVGAYCIAYRDGFKPVTVISDISEVDHMFKGQNKDNWLKWTSDMYGKFVQQRALKKQYGIEFGDEEAPNPQDSRDPYEPRQRVDITPETKGVDTGDQVIDPEEELAKVWTEIQKKTKERGVSKTDLNKFVQEKFEKKGKELTLQETVALNKLIDFHFPKQEEKQDAEAMSFDDFEGMTLE